MEQEADIVRHLRMQPFTRDEIDAVKAGILEASVQGEATRSYASRGEYSGRTLRRWAGYGASVVVMLAVAITGIDRIISRPALEPVKTYTTTRAQRANITLGDGSNVILAPATTIRVNSRNIELSGEAVFTVSPNSNSPFLVKAGNSTTRVLGTTFGVRAYQSEKSVRVAVAVGRVAVASSVLAAGDVATISNDTSAPIITGGSDISLAFAWTSGRLPFDRTPLPEALRELERWYNIQFVLGSASLNDRYITTSLGTQSLEEVVRILSTILGARAERTASTITFYTR